MTISVVDICRYPVKGLNAEALERVDLAPGQGVPHDRRFAIAHGSTQFDREAPKWLPKTSFFMLMRDEKLAQLHASFDAEDSKLTIERAGKPVVSADPTDLVAWQALVQVLAQEGRGEEALARLGAALASEEPPVQLFAVSAQLHAARSDAQGADSPQARFKVLAALTRLRQICCHPRLVAGDEVFEATGADPDSVGGKFELLFELLRECIEEEHRVLVFSQFTSMLDLMEERLDDLDVRLAVARESVDLPVEGVEQARHVGVVLAQNRKNLSHLASRRGARTVNVMVKRYAIAQTLR